MQLHHLPASKDNASQHATTAHLFPTYTTFQKHSHGHYRTATRLARMLPLFYYDWQIHPLAQIYSNRQHRSGHNNTTFLRIGSFNLVHSFESQPTRDCLPFKSKLFTRLRTTTGSERFRTTAYHPQANGLVGRFHRQLKTAIMCHNIEDWATIVPTVLLGIRKD